MINLAPLLNAPPIVQIHVFCTLSSLILGGIQLYAMKGGARHRIFGRIWVTLMATAVISSFFIDAKLRILFGYSPIHILSIITLIALSFAVYFARIGNLKAHRYTMINTYWFGLVVTGLFTLIPPRLMSQVLGFFTP